MHSFSLTREMIRRNGVLQSLSLATIRRNGFTPYQYVIGKSPRIPTSLVEVMEGDDRRLCANSAALFEDGPRRAEQIRAAANRAFFELDTDDAVRRVLVGRVRPPRGPFLPGQLVYCWRNSRTKAFPRGCRCHKDGEDLVLCWHAREIPGCI